MANTEKIPKTKEHRERSPRSNQKLKIMYLMKIFMEDTDEDHAITLQQIVGVFTIMEVREGKGSDKGWGKLKSGGGRISLDYCQRV